MGNIITPVLPHDLPENWNDTQYVSPGGTEVGLTEKHGYNYLMKQVNNSQKAINELDSEMAEISTTLQNKAPSGYGLGTAGAAIDSGKDLNDIWQCGFYSWDNGVSNSPFAWGLMVVLSPGNFLNGRVQIAYDRVNKTIAIRWLNTTWSPWEYQNPPMKIGVEYRTTERHDGNPVYKKMDSNGVIWWSTDQSTWKRGAERVGAAPDGYGLGDVAMWLDPTIDLNNIKKTGWYRWFDTPINAPGNFGAMTVVVTAPDGRLVQEVVFVLPKFDGTHDYNVNCKVRRVCYQNTWQPWEWENPPMMLGVEYRTTERHLGNPVYVKTISIGALPNATTKGVDTDISIAYSIIDRAVYSINPDGYSIVDMNRFELEDRFDMGSASWTYRVISTADFSAYTTTYVTFKYTKD